eukprot:3296223-Pyramimonas_sp.AAC.1
MSGIVAARSSIAAETCGRSRTSPSTSCCAAGAAAAATARRGGQVGGPSAAPATIKQACYRQ